MRTPASTYRLQINPDFDLYAAAALLDYLHDLGVDWVYLSPLLEAEPGSTHGYDVVRHDRVDPARGGADGLAAVSAAAKRLGMGVLVDIVPNHMGVATPAENPWWWEVLRTGRDSVYADFFDIDWEMGGGRLRIPVVGDDDLLPDGSIAHLSVVGSGEQAELHYHDNRYPIAPGTGPETGQGTPDEVHARQAYELVGWRTADDRLNYRRFFSVNTLAGIRVEDQAVFSASHVEIRRWFDEGLVDGLRVDHPDGLRNPGGYLADLAGLTGSAYVLVEKILQDGEPLETSWDTAGTTGYDALGLVDRVLTAPTGRAPLSGLAERLGAPTDWAELIHGTKRAVADGALRSEVNRIVRDLGADGSGGFETVARATSSTTADPTGATSSTDGPVVEEGRSPVSKPPDELADAVAELLACFGVYRSYLPAGREHVEAAFAAARASRPDLAAAYDALAPLLGDAEHPAAKRFQQTSGMVMAKGVEDCSFYRYPRLTSLNEVGGEPGVFDLDVAAFHHAMAVRQRDWPHAMTTLTTHDTKRSEDVRARITTLAELPTVWATALDQLLAAAPLPDAGFGELLWQAVLGVWGSDPDDVLRERLHGYAEKAMREAGDRTTWTAPDQAYEAAVHAAVDAAFDDPAARVTLDDLLHRTEAAGWSNALAAKLVALALPGVPDVYQGSELAEQSLVDPDNRRPVDFAERRRLLTEGAEAGWPGDKLRVVRAALTARRDQPELFTSYAGVPARGDAADHVLAFDRGGAIAVATRLPVLLDLAGGWRDTVLALPDGEWRDLLTDRVVSARVDDVLRDLPVALLVRA